MQGADDGNAATHAGFKQKVDMLFGGDGQQLGALGGNQLLVGSDHRLAGLQAGLYKVIGRVQAAHHFHHHRNFGVTKDDVKVLDKFIAVRKLGKIPQIQDIFDFDGGAGLFCQRLGAFHYDFGHAGTYNAVPHKCDFCHGFILQ